MSYEQIASPLMIGNWLQWKIGLFHCTSRSYIDSLVSPVITGDLSRIMPMLPDDWLSCYMEAAHAKPRTRKNFFSDGSMDLGRAHQQDEKPSTAMPSWFQEAHPTQNRCQEAWSWCDPVSETWQWRVHGCCLAVILWRGEKRIIVLIRWRFSHCIGRLPNNFIITCMALNISRSWPITSSGTHAFFSKTWYSSTSVDGGSGCL